MVLVYYVGPSKGCDYCYYCNHGECWWCHLGVKVSLICGQLVDRLSILKKIKIGCILRVSIVSEDWTALAKKTLKHIYVCVCVCMCVCVYIYGY
jgi:predicted Na+-dependent transporter